MTAQTMSTYGVDARRARAPAAPAVEHRRDDLQFKLIFSFCLAFHLPAAVLVRLDPRSWRAASPRRSAFAEAWEASGTTARIAFSG